MTHRPALDAARLDRAFEITAGHVRSGVTRYAALAVARGDGLVRSEAYGTDGPLEHPPRSIIASITKPITAVAVLQLVEEGRLVLSEPISTYLPEFTPTPVHPSTPGDPITPWHVLTHTAGLRDAPQRHVWSRASSREGILASLCEQHLAFAPGTAYAYCSDSFYLLDELVTRVGGTPYREHLRRRIFEPLGMVATTFDPRDPGPPPVRVEEDFDLEHFVALAFPGGGLWSVPEDLVRFGRALLHGGTLDGARVLGRPYVELMTRHHTEHVLERGDPPRRPGYGLALGLVGLDPTMPAGPRAFGHTGATGTRLLIDPDHDLVIVHLRSDWGTTMTATHEVVQAVYGALG